MTVLKLITRAMRLPNIIGIGELPEADEQQDLLDTLNEFIGTLNRMGLAMFYNTRTLISFLSATEELTVGVGGNINITRPDELENISRYVSSTETPLTILKNQNEWSRIRQKTATGTLPTHVYYEPEMPLGKLHVYPVPTSAVPGYLYVKGRLVKFTSLTEDVVLPDGYDRMLRYNMAVEYAAEYDIRVREDVMSIAQETLGAIKSANIKSVVMENETSLLNGSGGGSGYDIQSDSHF